MKTVSLLFLCLFAFNSAFADLLTLTPNASSFKIKSVVLSQTASTKINDKDTDLVNVGSGLRAKYLLPILGTPVYVAQVFAADPANYKKSSTGNESLASLEKQPAVAVRLDFLFNVSADKVYNAFVDALTANEVNLDDPTIAKFLANVQNGDDAPNGSSMTFLMYKNADGSETLTYEDPSGKLASVTGSAGLSKEILSMWLGNISSDDTGLQELKDQLTK